MGTTRTCPRCGGSFSGTLDVCPTDRTPLFAPEIVARIGMLLKDHEIQGVIGEGGMGVVYRAQHVVLEKPVAIKVLHDRFAQQTEVVEQFILEAKAASRIRHPNIIDVTDIGTTDDGQVFMVMEYLEGENLEERLRRVHRFSVFDAVNIVGQVARGLGAAHELGIVHRDLKPANIFLVTREGRRRVIRRSTDAAGVRFAVEPEGTYDMVKLLDFGVAKFLDLGPSAATRAGVICGTPYYLSPEQAQEKPADRRSDIYSLGAVFYEMLTGVIPFSGKSMLEILNGHVSRAVIPPSQRAPDARIDARTEAVVCKCLAKNPDARFASADELGEALRECVNDRVFLRDAARLPGIETAGPEISRSIQSARRGESPSLESPSLDEVDVPFEDDEPTGVEEPGGNRESLWRDQLEELDVPDTDTFSGTMRIDSLRAQAKKRLWFGAALVVLAGGGIALWAGLKDRRPAAPVQPVAAPAPPMQPASPPTATLPPSTPTPAIPPASPPTALPAPVVKPTAPAPVAAAGSPSPPAKLPASPAGATPARPRRGVEEYAHHLPAGFKLPDPTAATAAEPPPPTPAAAEPPPPTPAAAELPPKAPAPAAAPASSAGDSEALLREAQQAWARHHFAVAIDKAQAVLALSPDEPRAYQIIAVCSCALKNTAEAKQASAHLDSGKRKLVRSLCEKDGVILDPE
jgi:serine/threonine protein kinase